MQSNAAKVAASFLELLASKPPQGEQAKAMALYGWLIGSWQLDTVHRMDDGSVRHWDGECHFGWVLRGRAIQDVWIRPKRPAPPTMYGTTLRVPNAAAGTWQILWSDPLNGDYAHQTGRAEGNDIVQIGTNSRGLETCWRFTEISAESFHWIGEERHAGNIPWRVTYEHFASRTLD